MESRRDGLQIGSTPLHDAAWKCREHIVRLLIEAKADVDAKDEVGDMWM